MDLLILVSTRKAILRAPSKILN